MNNKKLTLLIALSISMMIACIFCVKITAAQNIQVKNEEPAAAVSQNEEPLQEKKDNIKIPIVEKPAVNEYSISENASTFKSWMPYTAITNRASAAYKQQQFAYTDKNGLRKIGDDYCVAMGTYYSSTIGDRFKITMDTGKTFTVIISDIKSNMHTDSTHRYTISNGCMMEFVIDGSCLNSTVRLTGNVGSLELFSGTFTKIEKLS